MVAHRAPGDAARAAEVGRDHAAPALCRPAPKQIRKVGRLGDQMLVVLGERRFDLGERRARARREDQFPRRIERDAGEVPRGERGRRLHGPQHAAFAAEAFDGERLAARRRLADCIGNSRLIGWRAHRDRKQTFFGSFS